MPGTKHDRDDPANIRVSVKIRESMQRRLTTYMNAQPVPVNRSSVFIQALDEFLSRGAVPAVKTNRPDW